MIRRISAVVGGLVAGSICVGAVEWLGHKLYPLPAGIKPDDVEAFKEYVATAPFMALLFVILAYAVGALVAGFISTKIANDGKSRSAVICGALFLAATIYNMVVLPTPIWFWVLGIAVWGLVWVGYKLALNKTRV
ncbi:hypothetical protein ATE47_09340 [Chryseobacterium sp. IHB B 17019]|jgi:hypothetical protein|uniref:hypothetical protein n=1 Tax=Chryseobacterium sp. IHB B 17019 TaxID=1721091 RepID=UPI00072174E8|nr:hypothetical protein [Chryseobacterium sp. IHB B 17019]ALR30718.1 hypothetical protein ATE47_09340 [Chryseobacterium sp. IHB B 17019]